VALDLGGPSGHVAEEIDGERDVGGTRDGERFAVVERFELREFFEVLLEQIGELPNELASFGGRHAAPGTFIEGIARGGNGEVDVSSIAFGNPCHFLAGGWVVGGKSLAGNGIDPLA